MRSRNFFGRIAIFMMVITSLLALPAAVTATNADNANYLASCNFSNFYPGGVELFNLENQSGGSRVWCVQSTTTDSHFGGFPDGFSDAFLGDVGSFNDKTESITIRVNPGCSIQLDLAYGTSLSGGTVTYYKTNTEETVKYFDINVVDNAFSSGRILPNNVPGKTCLGL